MARGSFSDILHLYNTIFMKKCKKVGYINFLLTFLTRGEKLIKTLYLPALTRTFDIFFIAYGQG